jgi:hypothetical protein
MPMPDDLANQDRTRLDNAHPFRDNDPRSVNIMMLMYGLAPRDCQDPTNMHLREQIRATNSILQQLAKPLFDLVCNLETDFVGSAPFYFLPGSIVAGISVQAVIGLRLKTQNGPMPMCQWAMGQWAACQTKR